MFRNIAIALVAASVLAAPVMAQNTLSGGSKASPATPSSETSEKADKSPEKSAETSESAEKSATKRHRVARHHHHHGAKTAKYGKSRSGMAQYGKHGLKTEKYSKYESRRHGRTMGRHSYGAGKMSREGATHTYGRSSKRMHTPSKATSSPSVD
jgi:Ni/Co efflux regulator RcnB